VNIKKLHGNWDAGFSLDKHMKHSVPIGHDQSGRMQFDNTRSPMGEAVYQLKYQQDPTQINIIGGAICNYLGQFITQFVHVIIPMPPSKLGRKLQPAIEIARYVSRRLGIYYSQDLLIKQTSTNQMKDIAARSEKVSALTGAFKVQNVLSNGTGYNILIIDDLFDSGASLEVATNELRKYDRINRIHVVTATRTK
jgi:predicted amidophosphoribosyltransferase